jgi:sensor c-di-GMP phosphodiesterase-like protein
VNSSFDKLKIDRAFVSSILQRSSIREHHPSKLSLPCAKGLGISTMVAEGIEEQAPGGQADPVRLFAGGQGYLSSAGRSMRTPRLDTSTTPIAARHGRR